MADLRHGGNVWEGGDPSRWLDFSANLRPEGAPEWVMRTMRAALDDTRYYPDRTLAAARRGLAAYLDVPERCVLPTAGGAAAIDAVLARGRGAVHVFPVTFGEYAERAAAHGRETRIWQGTCARGDTVVLCNPNNPTGRGLSREAALEMHRQAAGMGGELIVDEAFIEFCPECSVCRRVAPGLTVVGSLTKTLCIPGVRLGYVCAEPEIVEALERRALPWPMNALAVAVAAELPRHKSEIASDAALNRKRRALLARLLEKLGAEALPSQSNFLLVNFHRDMTQAAAQLRERHILVRTCASFGLGPEYWRVAVKTQEENLLLCQTLEEIFNAR